MPVECAACTAIDDSYNHRVEVGHVERLELARRCVCGGSSLENQILIEAEIVRAKRGEVFDSTPELPRASCDAKESEGAHAPAPPLAEDRTTDVVAHLPPLLTASEAARALRVSVTTFKRWIAAGRLKVVRPVESRSGHLRIQRVELERFLKSLA